MYLSFYNDFDILLPLIFLFSSILMLLMCGTFMQSLDKHVSNEKVSFIYINYLGLQILMFTILLMVNSSFSGGTLLNGLLIENYFTFIMKILVLFAVMTIMIMAFQYHKFEKFNFFEFHILLLLSTLGMILLISSHDFTVLYLAIELQSLSSYILASLKRDSQFSTEAGLKYFTLGSFASAFLLLGISFIYGMTGTTEFEQISHVLSTLGIYDDLHHYVIVFSMTFIFIALLFKLAAAPFHVWAPDVYEGSPTIVTAFFAIVSKIAILVTLIQICFHMFQEYMHIWQILIIFSSMASMILGAWGAILQKKIKRFLAYSSIGHVGYILVGLSTATAEGLQSTIFYLIIYIIMSLNVFTILLSLYKKDNSGKIIYIHELTGLSKENPLLALILSVSMFSMAGIPPLAGFVSKFQVFYAAMDSGFILLAIIGVLTSVVAAVYYIRIVKIMYFENKVSDTYKIMNSSMAFIISISFLITLLFMINPSYVLLLSETIALNSCL